MLFRSNRKLGLEKDVNDRSLSREDIIATIKYLVTLHAGDTRVQLLLASRRRTYSLRYCGDGARIHGIRTFRHRGNAIGGIAPD